MAAPANRISDDRVLVLMAWRVAGWSLSEIADHFDLSRARVAQLTDVVLAADLAESGEPAVDVLRHYWRINRRGRHAG